MQAFKYQLKFRKYFSKYTCTMPRMFAFKNHGFVLHNTQFRIMINDYYRELLWMLLILPVKVNLRLSECCWQVTDGWTSVKFCLKRVAFRTTSNKVIINYLKITNTECSSQVFKFNLSKE
jgi:hypothetical protein